jgi:hypothetical protein
MKSLVIFQKEKLPGYLSAFISGAQLRLHRDQPPPPPRTWKELLVHPYCEGFRATASNDMPADGLTKALPRQRHERFVQQLGLVDIGQRLKKP